MKTSLVAFATAFALTLGASSASFAQDGNGAQSADSLQECLVEEGAGATPPGDSLVSESGPNIASTSNGPSAEGLDPALGDAVPCPDVAGGASDDESN